MSLFRSVSNTKMPMAMGLAILVAMLFVSALQSAPQPAPATDPGTKTEGKQADAPAPKQEAPVEKPRESVWMLIKKGGWTMLGLGLISVLIAAFGLERGFYFRRQKVSTKGYFQRIEQALAAGGVEAVKKEIAGDDLLLSRILNRALERLPEGQAAFEKSVESNASVEVGNLERGLNLLSNLGNLAPLLGFFGTVVGMRNSFLQFVEKAAPTAQDLAGGVEEALITTAAGLLIAIPTYLLYNLFIYYIDSLTIELERSASSILNETRG